MKKIYVAFVAVAFFMPLTHCAAPKQTSTPEKPSSANKITSPHTPPKAPKKPSTKGHVPPSPVPYGPKLQQQS